MSKHTPEPWTFDGFRISTDGTRETRVTNVDGNFVSIEPDIANGERIVACVNALAGIDDPAAFVAAVDEAIVTLDLLEAGLSAKVPPSHIVYTSKQGGANVAASIRDALRLARGEVRK